ncbi:MAG: diguanylate phosphodiesterase, partial [Oxalobacteraceae bacterium]|nr:diguanylate phosphodiesterase [Oxalobacteraceae bacterium]
MKFQALQAYLERLKLRNDEDEKLWVDEYGRVQG